ncbi:conserved hypothetical protein [Theileria orientalis strain Shintoku]|uniref:Uncharacterized protein n=1 Tax=Theileria orientalis strain Shintoku TaxID=869250 RepID=J4C3N9_THEOR|nr:conserved hypothetical protein [Theileria orientalis strain Shintoku]BAM40771.1 conserved hypothetical protein [Theileria orientalis strain Shintoku]|eukprot:XP_009691072.1 conserved hypothetical protein [Theileria orientalis strain Shintoku]
MRTRWLVLLSIVTLVLITLVGFFIAYQFRKPSYKPRFRLSETSTSAKSGDRKSVMQMKGNIISSIAKNSKKNLKGPIPDDIDFDIGSTCERGSSSYVKVFETAYADIPGFKGYTHVLKAKLPVKKYFNKDAEQSGLPTGLDLEAVLTYFKEDRLDQDPLVVCPVSSIEDKEFSCYLMDSKNQWSVSDCINGLDLMDDSFGDDAGRCINNHYNMSEISPQPTKCSPSSPDQEDYDSFELELSLKQGFENAHFVVGEVERLTVPGFKGFGYKMKSKSKITKYTYNGDEQHGLPTGVPFEIFLTYYVENKLDQSPVGVCAVKSKNSKTFDCYLLVSPNSWQHNTEISELKIHDRSFGEKPSSEDKYPETELPEPEPESTVAESEDLILDADLETEADGASEQSLTKIPVLDISKTESDDESIEIQEFDDLNIPNYRAFGMLFENRAPVEKYVSRGVEQKGLPINYPLDGVLSIIHDQFPDPLVVCAIYSMDDMMYDCFLKESDNVWVKSDKMSEMDFTSDNFGEEAAQLVNEHYGVENSGNVETNESED